MIYILYALGVVSVALGVAFLLWYFPNAQTGYLVKFVVGSAWFAALSILLLVPADVKATLNGAVNSGENATELFSEEPGGTPPTTVEPRQKTLLEIWWLVAYWYAFACMMGLLPLLQGYADSGDFYVQDKFLYSLRTNGQFYLCVLVAFVILLVLLLFMGLFNIWHISGWIMAISNAYGLLGSIFLMGYGLVDIPRKLWQKADIRRRELLLFHQAGVQVERAGQAHVELSRAIAVVRRVSELFGRRDPLRPYLDRIEGMMTQVGEFTPQQVDLENEEVDLDYFTRQDLGKLRRELRHGIQGFEREQELYLQTVRTYIKVHEILKNIDRIGVPFNRVVASDRPAWVGHLEWWWKCRLQPIAMRVSAIALALVSVAVVMAEVGMSPSLPNLSVFAFLLNKGREQEASVFFATFVFLLYPAICMYYSLFKLGRFSFYLLVPRHTAPYSLVSNALFMCRFASPLAFNFLAAFVLPLGKGLDPTIEHTVFFKYLGQPMAENPVFGAKFNTYIPIAILPYMLLVIFNVFNRVASIFDRAHKLSFEEDWDVTSTYASTGQSMLRREVENYEAQLPLGLTVSQASDQSHPTPTELVRRSVERRSVDRVGGKRTSWSGDSKYQEALEKGVSGRSEARFQSARNRLADAVSRINDNGNSRFGFGRNGGGVGGGEEGRERSRSTDTSRLDNIFADITTTSGEGRNRRHSGGYSPLRNVQVDLERNQERSWFKFGRGGKGLF